jgi:hypothetical protein
MEEKIIQLNQLIRRSLFVDNSNEEGQLIYDLNRFNVTLRDEVEATNNEELKSLYDLSSIIEERIRRFGI